MTKSEEFLGVAANVFWGKFGVFHGLYMVIMLEDLQHTLCPFDVTAKYMYIIWILSQPLVLMALKKSYPQ